MSKKQYYIPFSIVPRYNKECNELLFYIPLASFMTDITFKDYFISNHNKPTTNYKSIHFIMNNKELNEEEIQNYTLSDPENEIIIFYQDKEELFKMHYHIKVVLHNPIDPMFNFPEIFFSSVIRTKDEIYIL
jgi:hypothetical protein